MIVSIHQTRKQAKGDEKGVKTQQNDATKRRDETQQNATKQRDKATQQLTTPWRSQQMTCLR
eukprot:3496839-Ditylum_brightwellii.AAC.1